MTKKYYSRFWYRTIKMSSARDQAILNTILNPFLPTGDFFEDDTDCSKNDDYELTNDVIEAKKLEKEAVILAEKDQVEEAVKIFTKAIGIVPDFPSLYNNRAQAYRLIGEEENALNDLNQAILLSKGKGKSCRQALCQRGLLYKKRGDDERAIKDFKMAAQLGSPFAKMALVQLNPYAALCNQMLSQVMEKLRNGE